MPSKQQVKAKSSQQQFARRQSTIYEIKLESLVYSLGNLTKLENEDLRKGKNN